MRFIKKNYLFVSLIIIYLAGLLVYFNSFKGEFVFDDFNTIIKQEKLKKIADLPGIWSISHSRFIPYLTLALNYSIDKFNPRFYHLFNFIFHALNSIILYFLVTVILKTPAVLNLNLKNNKFLPFITSLIFMVHPVQSGAVNYISQRSTLLVTFFYLSTLLLYSYSRINTNKKRSYVLYALSLITFILTLLSKENSYSLPLTILFTEYLLFAKKTIKIKSVILRVFPFFLTGILIFYITYLEGPANPLIQISALNMLDEIKISRTEYLFTQFNVLIRYLSLLLLPVNQNVDYDFPLTGNLFEPLTFISFLIILSIIFLAVIIRNRKPLFTFGITFFFVTLLIESSVIPIKDVIFEHRLYLPSAGFFIAVLSLFINFKNKMYYYTFFSIIVLSYSFLTLNRSKVWQSEYALWKDAVLKSPNKPRVHYNLAVASYSIGKIEEARNEFNKTIILDRAYSDAYRNLGALYEYENKPDKTLELYTTRLKENPKDTKIRASLAAFYSKTGKYNDSISEYLKILEYDPSNALVYNDLGVIYFIQNNKDKTVYYFEQAIKLNPKYENAVMNLANSYYHFGDDEKARVYYSRLLKINPESAKKIPFTDLYPE